MRYERVFLIKPDYPNSYYADPTWPLGLGYVAESLKRAGFRYRVIDMGFGYRKRFLYKSISEFHPYIIGISMMSSKYKYHYALVKDIKKRFPEMPIVAGGPHVSTFREKVLLECPEINYGVTGEGEEAIVELCGGKDLSQIKGLFYKKNSGIAYTGDRERILDLDSVSFPRYEGFEIEKYNTLSINILSSRGCPYRCIYCPIKVVIGRRWQARSPKNVVDEIEYWHKKGYRAFTFNDDAFNIDRKRVFEICYEIERKNIKVELNAMNGIRADRADRELLTKMRKTGFSQIAFGVEAGNDKVLSNIKKGETIEQIKTAVKDACELGYQVTLFFLVGSPGENEKDIEDSFRLATEYPVTGVNFYNLIPFPNTELYEWVEKNNYFALSPGTYLNGNMHWSGTPVFSTPELSIKQRKRIYLRGLKLSNRLWKKYLFGHYKKVFRRLRLAGNLLAYILSRDIPQFLLKKSKPLNRLRIAFKKRIKP
jgi:radical SAM superfamily enzyme YgiQ (UPF0313 family)